jgi:5-methylcytosine-specific restriction endonuclease McrA
MDYSDYLMAPQWQAKRDEVLERDWHMCQKCMSSRNLQVHHKAYIVGRLPWEYDNQYLITLCGPCHAYFHATDKVPTLEHGDPIIEASARIVNSLKSLNGLSRG